jgi:hypothetical protein
MLNEVASIVRLPRRALSEEKLGWRSQLKALRDVWSRD